MDSHSTYSDVEIAEIKKMVLCFRVSELQALLGHAGKTKSGRKHELMTSALQLIKSPCFNKSVASKIHNLHNLRYSHDQHPMKESQYSSMCGQSGKRNKAITNSRPASCPEPPKARQHDSSIKFEPLPFYEHVSEVMRPKSMIPKPSKPMQDSSFKFRLTSQQGAKIHSGKTKKSKHQIKFDIQVQLRFCLLNTSCEQNDSLPSNLCVKINRSSVTLPPFISPTNTGQLPKRINRPVDITLNCLPLILSDEYYTLEIKWSSENHETVTNDRGYGVTVNLVQKLNVDDLLRKLKQVALIPPSTSRAVIKEKLSGDPESDITTTSLKIGKMRMNSPTRPLTCNHLQCFDAATFFMMNEKKPTWTCPVCDRPATFSKLAVDGLFVEILKSCNFDEIDFTEDGNWHCPKQRRKMETLDIGTPIKSIDLIDFDAKDGEPKTNEPIVIDLTCDSSEDETNSSSPFSVPNGTLMDICSSPLKTGNDVVDLSAQSGSSDHETSSFRKRLHCTSSSKPYSSLSHSPYKSNSHHDQYHSSNKSSKPSESVPSLRQPPITDHFFRCSRNKTSIPPPPHLQAPLPFASLSSLDKDEKIRSTWDISVVNSLNGPGFPMDLASHTPSSESHHQPLLPDPLFPPTLPLLFPDTPLQASDLTTSHPLSNTMRKVL